MERREFVKSAAAAGAGLLILPSGTLFGQNAPSNKLNVALIGVWGRATVHYNILASENVVALCDVNENRLAEGLQIFPKAKTYWDWRKCLEQKDIEAVVICAADHHHAFIANWALNRGMHVYCEKPLGICVDEVRTVRANYIKQRSKVATQQGTQRHAFPNFTRLRELILDGAIGELKTVSAWDTRRRGRPGYPPGEGQPPSFFHYDQWIGPSPFHPYTPQYFSRSEPGSGCQAWNIFRDFGVGQMGDMGAHTMDIVWNVIDAGPATGIEVDMNASDKFDPNVVAIKLKAVYDHPKNSWRGPITVVWHQGGLRPEPPRDYLDVTTMANGAIFEGTKGTIVADFNSRIILPNNDDGDLTYYKRRSKEQLLPLMGGTGEVQSVRRPSAARGSSPASSAASAARRASRGDDPAPTSDFYPVVLGPGGIPPEMLTPNGMIGHVSPGVVRGSVFQNDWLDACKGKNDKFAEGSSTKTHCDFDYSGTMMEEMLLALVSHRMGKKILYDPVAGRITNVSEANDYLKRQYRPGWTLNG
jgi:predicted dehydrogenase